MKVLLLILFFSKLYETSFCEEESKIGNTFEQKSRQLYHVRNKPELDLCEKDDCYLLVDKSLSKYNETLLKTKTKINLLWPTYINILYSLYKDGQTQIDNINQHLLDLYKLTSDILQIHNISQQSNNIIEEIITSEIDLNNTINSFMNPTNISKKVAKIFDLQFLLNNITIPKHVDEILIISKGNRKEAMHLYGKALELKVIDSFSDDLKEINLKLMQYNDILNNIPNIDISDFNQKFDMLESRLVDLKSSLNRVNTINNEFEMLISLNEESETINIDIMILEYICRIINNLINDYLNFLEAHENFKNIFKNYEESKQILYEELNNETQLQETEALALHNFIKKILFDLHILRGNVESYQRCIQKMEKIILRGNDMTKNLIVTENDIKKLEDELVLLEQEKMELDEIKQKENDLIAEIQYLEDEIERLKKIEQQLDSINITCIPKITLN